ncbi:MAG: LicD family protein [Bacilli bacterium]|nr:LicD family protein [Bacilli bacterium]
MKNFGTYDEKTLKMLQKVELEMLKDINKVCEKYDIKYFALDGTGIGAMRHKGFIPWDDDIDLRFLEKDVSKFVKCMQEEMPDKYYFVNETSFKNYPLSFTKMCKKDTIFVEHATANSGVEIGIFIDIVPMVYVDDNEKIRNKKLLKSWYIYKLGVLAAVKNPVLSFGGIKAKIVVAGCYIIHYLLKLLHLDSGFFFKKGYKVALANKKTNTIASLNTVYKLTSIYSVNDVFPVVKTKFEDTYVYVPKECDKLLRIYFGDYMELPPEEKRHNHCPKKLVFDKEKESENKV